MNTRPRKTNMIRLTEPAFKLAEEYADLAGMNVTNAANFLILKPLQARKFIDVMKNNKPYKQQ